MLIVETIAKIRRAYFVQGKAISHELKASRNVVRKAIRLGETAFTYERRVQPRPKIGPWQEELDQLLATNAKRPSREQRQQAQSIGRGSPLHPRRVSRRRAEALACQR